MSDFDPMSALRSRAKRGGVSKADTAFYRAILARLEAAEQENERLREANLELETEVICLRSGRSFLRGLLMQSLGWVQHEGDCAWPQKACDCGLDAWGEVAKRESGYYDEDDAELDGGKE